METESCKIDRDNKVIIIIGRTRIMKQNYRDLKPIKFF